MPLHSLHSSPSPCMVLASNPQSSSKFKAKPARWPHRRRLVSCSMDRIDRRNMLLGMGGLCGGLPNALAAPIDAPNLYNCSAAHEFRTNDLLPENCCPPPSPTVTDYVFPKMDVMRVRRRAHTVDDAFIKKYEKGIRLMKELDDKDPDDPRGFKQQANIHCAYCNGAYAMAGSFGRSISVHFSWLFFPFHRWYLYFYERILGSLIGDPTFALPYWNWDNAAEGDAMRMPKMYDMEGSPLRDPRRDATHRGLAVINLMPGSRLANDDEIKASNLSVMHKNMIGDVRDVYDFMGRPYRGADPPPLSSNGGTVEKGCHTAVHVWVGDPNNKYREDLGNFYSAARDPIFFSLHSNVDRLWTVWNTLPDPQGEGATPIPRTINDPDYLNSAFLFYDENKNLVRVKVRDCLNNFNMGYTYEKAERPWLDYNAPTKPLADVTDLLKEASDAKDITESSPLVLDSTNKMVSVHRDTSKTDQVLVLENIMTNPTRLISFDVYVNDDSEDPQGANRAQYAGSFTQLVQGHVEALPKNQATYDKESLKINLKELYTNIRINNKDDKVLVTIAPRYNGEFVKIGGIKIIDL